MSVEETIPSGTVEGRGQGIPGPSTFARPLSARMMLVVFAGTLVAAVAQFILGTLLVEQGGRVAVAAAVSLLLGVLLLAVGKRPARADASMIGAGVLGLVLGAAAPAIYVLNQYSDAPSGTLVMFWTTVFPGALVLAVAGSGRLRGLARAASLGLLAAFCAAGVLGNWERPSSFSLLARHIPQQLALAAGSLVLVLGLAALAWLMRVKGWRAVAFSAGVGALVGAIGLVMVSGDPLGALAMVLSPMVFAFAASFAVTIALALVALVRGGGSASGGALLLAPSALSLLVFVEAAVGALGPEPILRVPVMWASAASLAVVIAAVLGEREDQRAEGASAAGLPLVRGARSLTSGLALAALAGTILAAIGLAAGALDVSVAGRYTSGERFAATFVMRGWETVGGWMVLGMALLALASVYGRPRPVSKVMTGVALGVAALAWKVIGATPLHTWVTWVPADVQQDYGSEYARIAFTAVPVWFQMAATTVAVALGLFLIVNGVARLRTPATAEESES